MRTRPVLEAIEAADAVALAEHLATSSVPFVDDAGRSIVQCIVDAITTNGSIPLVRNDRPRPLLDVALAAGASPDQPDARGWTPLHTAVRSGDREFGEALVRAGASVTAGADEALGAPVHHALFYGQPEAALVVRIDPPSLREAAGLGDLAALNEALDADVPRRYAFYRPSHHFPVWTRTLSRAERIAEALT